MLKQFSVLREIPVFQNFTPAPELPQLRKHNVIYGFNGSGKTTLSRIMCSLETGEIQERLPAGTRFSIDLEDGTSITEATRLDVLKGQVLVFNEDYVGQCLRWKDGTANPVFYIGTDQADLAKQLAVLESESAGLQTTRDKAELASKQAQKQSENYNRQRASLIAEVLNLGRKYRAPNLANDYQAKSYGADCQQDEAVRKKLRNLIGQDEPLAKKPVPSIGIPSLAELHKSTVDLVAVTIGQVTLDDLKDHPLMLTWVKEGLTYHEQQGLSDCLFCGNALTHERRAALNAFVDDRFDKLTGEIQASMQAVASRKDALKEFATQLPDPDTISEGVRTAYAQNRKKLADRIDAGMTLLGGILAVLEAKSKNPNTPITKDDLPAADQCSAWDAEFDALMGKVQEDVKGHNKAHDEFNQQKDKARDALKSHFLAEGQDEYKQLSAALQKAEADLKAAADAIGKHQDDIQKLKEKVRKHGPAAEVINKLLECYLGHDELKVVVQDGDEPGYQILRRGKPVDDTLSEGERTALSLCYFLSSLKAENRKVKDLIVVIDDPVSSLDSRALNYAFNLIKSALAEARQLIILTHNMAFMNEVKNWLARHSKVKPGDPPKPPTAAMWFIESRLPNGGGVRQSKIVQLPKLLRDYHSEYHYLFHLAHHFSTEGGAQDDFAYLMPNVLRKVLELFLTFKYPGADGLGSKVESVGRDYKDEIDVARMNAISRLVHVESHADNLDKLITHASMTVEESREAADALLVVMSKMDDGHYKKLKKICR